MAPRKLQDIISRTEYGDDSKFTTLYTVKQADPQQQSKGIHFFEFSEMKKCDCCLQCS